MIYAIVMDGKITERVYDPPLTDEQLALNQQPGMQQQIWPLDIVECQVGPDDMPDGFDYEVGGGYVKKIFKCRPKTSDEKTKEALQRTIETRESSIGHREIEREVTLRVLKALVEFAATQETPINKLNVSKDDFSLISHWLQIRESNPIK